MNTVGTVVLSAAVILGLLWIVIPLDKLKAFKLAKEDFNSPTTIKFLGGVVIVCCIIIYMILKNN